MALAYLLSAALVIGMRLSTSFCCFVLLLLGAWLFSMWRRGLLWTRPRGSVPVIGVTVSVPRAVANIPTKWRKERW